MFDFETIPIDRLTPAEADRISANISSLPMGEMIIDWCRYIRETACNPIEIEIIRIKKDSRFYGIAILTLLPGLKWVNLLPVSLSKFSFLLNWKRRNPFLLNIGLINIPFVHRPGLFPASGIPVTEYPQIYMDLIRYLRSHKSGMHALCICTDPACRSDDLLAEAGLMRKPFNMQTILDYPYQSFAEYYATLSTSKKKDIRRTKNVLQRYGGTIEVSSDFQSIAAEVTTLFKSTTDPKGGLRLIEFDEKFFSELARLKSHNPRFLLMRAENKLVGFFFIFQCGDTLFLKSCGLDYDLSLKTRAYFNLFYAAMEYAVEHNLKKIDCGGSSNYFKESKINCQLTPTTYWIDFYHPLLWPLKWVGRLFPLLRYFPNKKKRHL